ncbi:MAG: SCP2 sterol-binding domain-containing protein [Desulfobacterales bacterium]|nr:SCP2 sterol-binding domain-containing protein [Desulfobacterales bacterium]
MKLKNHPTVKAYYNSKKADPTPSLLEASWIKKTVLESGADDVGIIDLKREAVSKGLQDLRDVMPDMQSIIVMAFAVNQCSIRSMAQSVTDNEFKQIWTLAGHAGRTIAKKFRDKHINAVNMPMGFHQETGRWPGKMWLTEDKVLAAEAGLGHMGYNRLVIHPKLGASIILGTILISAPCDVYDQPLDFNPCIECGLCVKVCPTGAVKATDSFDMLSCLTHNYRERLGGFQNWVEQIVESKTVSDYRSRVSDQESVSMWQHLAIGAQNKCDRCMAVCPAGEIAVGEFLEDRKSFIKSQVNRFRDLEETIYAIKGSAAEKHVRDKFPNKKVKHVSNGIRPVSASRFLGSLPLAFSAHNSKGLNAVYHFIFTGGENLEGTVVIENQSIRVHEGLQGTPDLKITADSTTWIKFLTKDVGLLKALITGKLKIKGPIKLMKQFAACFPS